VVSSTQFTCTFDLTGATTGLWNVKLRNSDGTYYTLANGFEVTPLT
jgi:hypothetical protein